MKREKIILILEQWLDLERECDMSTGYCMCGDKVEYHGLGSGHSPVDMGHYYVGAAIQATNEILDELKAEKPTLAELVCKSWTYLTQPFRKRNPLDF